MTPDEILAELKRLDVSQDQIAAVIKRDRSAVSRLLTGRRQMKTSEIAPLARFVSTEWRRSINSLQGADESIFDVDPLPAGPQGETLVQANYIPVFETDSGGSFICNTTGTTGPLAVTLRIGSSIGRLPLPASFLWHRSAFALYCADDALSPRYERGDIVIVDDRRNPQVLDYVAVELRNQQSRTGASLIIARLLGSRRGDGVNEFELEQFHPPVKAWLGLDKFISMQRVVSWNEILGV